ncbi:MAG TPA: tryptophan synthase subunit alpha [Firmicutes bacterium]|nr:tryptophan synthase subunit alpha [Bacillota bacterium]
MSRLRKRFERNALIPYLTAGYPDLETSKRLLLTAARDGADIIEIGIPFSDPLADGPILQEAAGQALQNGTTIAKVMEIAGEVYEEIRREGLNTELVFMVYYNLVYSWGEDRFVEAAAKAGVAGLIVPDLPYEEASGLAEKAEEAGMDLIYLVAPNTPPERIQQIGERSRGFIYAVSLHGVTGPREKLPKDLTELVARIKANVDVPVAVGFGISSAEQAVEVTKIADGVIIGSVLAQLVKEAEDPCDALGQFIGQLRAALDNSRN